MTTDREQRPAPDAGAAAVEFALISTILFTLLFGILNYGFYFFQSTAAEAAAREGARRAAVGITDCDAWQQSVRDTAPSVQGSFGSIAAAGGGLTTRGEDITVTVTWDPTSFGIIPLPGGPRTETAITRGERIGTVSSC